MNSPILVTGASQRVGLALALELAQAGHTVVSASRSVQPQTAHPNIVQFQADLCQAADRRMETASHFITERDRIDARSVRQIA